MIMTLADIKNVLFWLNTFSFCTRFIYGVTLVAAAASLVYWDWYINWYMVGASASAYLLQFYLQFMIAQHNMRVMEIMRKIQESQQPPKK